MPMINNADIYNQEIKRIIAIKVQTIFKGKKLLHTHISLGDTRFAKARERDYKPARARQIEINYELRMVTKTM